MEFDFSKLTPPARYALMGSGVTPRPIAWITTVNEDGTHNAAPFSFFNVMSAEPPLLAVGIMRRPDGTLKDTTANIMRTQEFVVNMVSYADAEAMNLTAIDAPPGFDELAAAGLDTAESSFVAPPRIASAPIAMECRTFELIETTHSTIILGQIHRFHVRDEFVAPDTRKIDAGPMDLIGRIHGRGWYTRCAETFQLPMPEFAAWQAAQGETEA